VSPDDRSRGACEEISDLMPWYLNGTGSEEQRRRVEEHVAHCARCRRQLARDRCVYEGMNTKSTIEYMPAPSLKRLQARIDQLENTTLEKAPTPTRAAGRPAPVWSRRQGYMVASIVALALLTGLLVVDRWLQFRARGLAPSYYTLTAAVPRRAGAVIRAVFAPSITLVELQSILDQAGLRIVSGPTEAGVYSLAKNSDRPIQGSLAVMRANAKVRFAETIEPGSAPEESP
jgi:anti-sigma factor RsiW